MEFVSVSPLLLNIDNLSTADFFSNRTIEYIEYWVYALYLYKLDHFENSFILDVIGFFILLTLITIGSRVFSK